MRKLLSVCLSVVLLLGSLGVLPVAAAGEENVVALYLGEAEAGQGETVWIPVWLGEGSGLVCMDFRLVYDPEVWSFGGMEEPVETGLWKGLLAYQETNKGVVKFSAAKTGEGVSEGGLLLRVAFTAVAQTASAADITMDITNVNVRVDGHDQKADTRALTGLTVTPPSKTTYVAGQKLDPAGMVVTARYSDGTEESVDGYSYPDEPLVVGENTITVTYLDQTASFTVQADEPEDLEAEITQQATRLEYLRGEEVDLTGLVVTITHEDGASEEVSEGLTAVCDTGTAGEAVVTVSYQGQAIVTYTVQVYALGDVTKDGQINSSDARTILQSTVSLIELSAFEQRLADVAVDGQVNSSDARVVLQATVGLADL